MTETAIGLLAAAFTTVSYFPQLKKTWSTGETGDLSLRMLLLLATGLGLWLLYGVLREDLMIIIGNAISLTLVLFIGFFKTRETIRNHKSSGPRSPAPR